MTKAGHEEREKWRHSSEGKRVLSARGMERRNWSHDKKETHEEQLTQAVLVKVFTAFEAGYNAGHVNGRREAMEQIQRCVETTNESK